MINIEIDRETARILTGLEDTPTYNSVAIRRAQRKLQLHDSDTHHHRTREHQLTLAVGSRYKLGDAALGVLHIGSQLHDIGKTEIDPEILQRKPTESEMSIVEQHPEEGARIIYRITGNEDAATIEGDHHTLKKYNPYPAHRVNLRQTNPDLDFLTQIVAASDIVDRIFVAGMPDKPPLSYEEAIEAMVETTVLRYEMINVALEEAQGLKDKIAAEVTNLGVQDFCAAAPWRFSLALNGELTYD